MKRLSEKITDYILRSGAIQKESYALYQYGFQIGLEMISCLLVCFIIAWYLHMILEFLVSSITFILLRTYAGGVHLNSYKGCFVISVFVQTLVVICNETFYFSLNVSWVIILCSSVCIWIFSPVECISRELDAEEKKHCKNLTLKIICFIFLFLVICMVRHAFQIVSLVALTESIVLISQCLGIIKFRIEKKGKMEMIE